MVINNNELQNRIGITIDDYKKESGRYRTIKNNGLGKEIKIETNIILFRGNIKKKKGMEWEWNMMKKQEKYYT